MERIWIKEATSYLNQSVRLGGWVETRRDHGKIIFIDLRDRTSKVQLGFLPQDKEVYELAETNIN